MVAEIIFKGQLLGTVFYVLRVTALKCVLCIKDVPVCSEQAEHIHSLRATAWSYVLRMKGNCVELCVMHYQTQTEPTFMQ